MGATPAYSYAWSMAVVCGCSMAVGAAVAFFISEAAEGDAGGCSMVVGAPVAYS